jgi:NadR type nicotinamide-nucleotide adenylyltransferase
LIDSALDQAEEVYVMVCHKPDQSIPGPLRVAWLREIHPRAKVFEVDDTLGDDDTEAWAYFTVHFLGFVPDVVFSSEDYGPLFARAMGSAHIFIDRDRQTIPCSGTMIRGNPFACFQFLEPCVRAWFVKRVCLVGAESSGKTTLAQALASHYGEPWMPEYAREYCEQKYGSTPFAQDEVETSLDDWKSEEFLAIALEHAKREDLLARESKGLLIVDTNAFATSIWHERYLGFLSPDVENVAQARQSLYALYILCDVDIPWVQDGTRDGAKIREGMHRRFIEKLDLSSRPWILASGIPEERISRSITAIDALLTEPEN